MIELDNFRKKYPQYNDMSDIDLANSLANKYPAYKDLTSRIGTEQPTQQQQPQQQKPSMLGTIAKAAFPGSALFQKETWQPAAQSITGKSLTQRSQEIPISAKMTGNKFMDIASAVGAGVSAFQRDVAASAVDMATTPANYLGGGIVSGASKLVTKARDIENRIFNLYNFAVGGKVKNAGEVAKVVPSRIQAMKTINENLPEIKFTNIDTGVLESRVPQNRFDLLQAFVQTKKLVWNKVNALSKGATEASAKINLPNIAKEALNDTKKQLGSVALKADPTLDKSLNAALQRLNKTGDITPTDSEDFMKYLNSEVIRLRNS